MHLHLVMIIRMIKKGITLVSLLFPMTYLSLEIVMIIKIGEE